jgi:hypothetical protein
MVSIVSDEFDGRLVAVSLRCGYLGDGDVLRFDHSSRKFRTLFRRNSAHNSFLVTERCNNYCLMCSQPPKDVDDRWILSEIKESLPLIGPATCALTFTGGETLSDREDFVAVLKECRDFYQPRDGTRLSPCSSIRECGLHRSEHDLAAKISGENRRLIL